MDNGFGFKPREVLYLAGKDEYTPDIREATSFTWDEENRCFTEKKHKSSLSENLGAFIVTVLSLSATVTVVLCCLKFIIWIWGL